MSVTSTPSVTDFGSLAQLRGEARAQDPESVRKAAQQFEALFLQQVLKSARAAQLGEDVLGGSQSEFYRDLFDQQMALHLAQGKGLGLADVLVRQMLPKAAVTTPQDAAAHAALPTPVVAASAAPAPMPVDDHAADWSAPNPDAVPLEAAAGRARALPVTRLATEAADTFETPTSRQHFIDQIRPHAERVGAALGVSADAIMAQAALETGWGKRLPRHADGSSSLNFFGIKAQRGWDGARLDTVTHEHLGGRMQRVTDSFRAYDSVGAAFDDYAAFLRDNPRYANALAQGDDPARFAAGLQRAGYATDPAYASKLLKLVRDVSISGTGV